MWALSNFRQPRTIPCLQAASAALLGERPCSFTKGAKLGQITKTAVPTAVRSFAMQIPRSNFYRDVPEGVSPIPVAIVGRPNVGKSTLFNRLQSSTKKKKTPIARKALTSARAGTTRDRKDAVAVFGGLVLRVIDTGGLEGEVATKNNTLLQGMRQQVWRAVAEASAVLFVIDAREGVTPLDIEIAGMLRDEDGYARYYQDAFSDDPAKEKVPIILVANKAEGGFIGSYLNDCYDLGVGDPVAISAHHNEGLEDLYDRLCIEVGHLQGGDEEENSDNEYEDESTEAGSDEVVDSDEDPFDDISSMQAGEDEVPQPTLPWLAPNSLTEHQKHSLRWFATHPDDPLGKLDPGLKASVLHRDSSDIKNYWLGKPQRLLPDKETRDFVMQHRRLEDQERPIRLAVVGMPNSGKSSLINALMQEERCVVDPVDGTTIDAIVSEWTFKDRPFKLIDTCGITKGWKYPGTHSDILEHGMGTRKAIRKAHVVVLCIDGRHRVQALYSTPSKFEIRLGNFVADEGKCLVIAVNKWDLVPEEDQAKFRAEILDSVKENFSQIKGVPVVFISGKYNLNLGTLMTRILALNKRWSARLPTGKINDWLQAWMIRWPPPWRFGQKRTIKYMTQTRSRPPSFVLWSNTTSGQFPKNYMRQLQNAMRDEFRISGVPMRMVIRSTLMPKPRRKLKKQDILKWQRVGPKQAEVVNNLTSKKTVRRRQTE